MRKYETNHMRNQKPVMCKHGSLIVQFDGSESVEMHRKHY